MQGMRDLPPATDDPAFGLRNRGNCGRCEALSDGLRPSSRQRHRVGGGNAGRNLAEGVREGILAR